MRWLRQNGSLRRMQPEGYDPFWSVTRFDQIKELAVPFRLHVIMTILGVPEEDEPFMLKLTQTSASPSESFPADKNETLDTDGDGIGNNADTDDDGDTVLDTEDAFPLDSTVDGDGDGVGDNADVFPQDKNEFADFDKDGVGDNADTDDDNDGTVDTADDKPFDAFPLDDTISVAQVLDSSKPLKNYSM